MDDEFRLIEPNEEILNDAPLFYDAPTLQARTCDNGRSKSVDDFYEKNVPPLLKRAISNTIQSTNAVLDEVSKDIRDYIDDIDDTLNAKRLCAPKNFLDELLAGLPDPAIKKETFGSHVGLTRIRNILVGQIKSLLVRKNWPPYIIQKCRRDKDDDGWHRQFTVMDVHTPPHKDPVKGNHTICYFDTDYYFDPLEFATGHPVVVLTKNFTKLYETGKDHTYYFTDPKTVRMSVNGGAVYTHEVWDYDRDQITYDVDPHRYVYKVYSVLCGPYKIVYLYPERKMYRQWKYDLINVFQRQIKIPWPATIIDSPLERLVIPSSDGYMHREIQNTDEGHIHQLMKIGAHAAVTIPNGVFVEAIVRARNTSKGVLEFGVMKRILESIPDASLATALLCDYVKNPIETELKPIGDDAWQPATLAVYTDPDYSVNHDNAEHTSAVPLTENAAGVTYVPAINESNMAASISVRATETQEVQTISAKTAKYMDEFVRLITKHSSKISIGQEESEELKANQTRPAQRKTIERGYTSAQDEVRRINPTNFLKTEPLSKPSVARNITMLDPSSKVYFTEIVLQLAKRIKEGLGIHYAFVTPSDLEDNMAEVFKVKPDATFVNQSDWSKMDGRYGRVGRLLELKFARALLNDKDYTIFEDLQNKLINSVVFNKFGLPYPLNYTRGSGEPGTSIFNTAANCFTVYLTFRLQGLSEEEALRRCGIYGGDDGITLDLDPIKYAHVTKKFFFGLIEADVVGINEPFTFLSRYFSPQTWVGEPNSWCTIPRALTKLSTTVKAHKGTRLEKFSEKLAALARTDGNTYVIRDYIRNFIRLGGKLPKIEKVDPLVSWWLTYDTSFVNTFDDELMPKTLPAPRDGEAMIKSFNECKSLNDLLYNTHVQEINFEANRNLIINGEAFIPGKYAPGKGTVSEPPAELKGKKEIRLNEDGSIKDEEKPKKTRTRNKKAKETAIPKTENKQEKPLPAKVKPSVAAPSPAVSIKPREQLVSLHRKGVRHK